MTAPLRIVVIAPDSLDCDPGDDHAWLEAERSRSLRIGLLSSGYNLVAVLPADTFLTERIAQIQPDMVIVDAQSGVRDSLEHVVLATRDARRPIVLFTDDPDTSSVGKAIASGVNAYVVAGLAPERIKPVMEVAIARFEYEERLRTELQQAQTRLSDRKVIDRAKGIVMARQKISEDEAFGMLRKTAMDKGLKLSDVAQRIVDVAELLA